MTGTTKYMDKRLKMKFEWKEGQAAASDVNLRISMRVSLLNVISDLSSLRWIPWS